MSRHPPPCPATAKLSFGHQADALVYIVLHDWGHNPRRSPIRAYRCPHCGHWHITSQPLHLKGHSS